MTPNAMQDRKNMVIRTHDINLRRIAVCDNARDGDARTRETGLEWIDGAG